VLCPLVGYLSDLRRRLSESLRTIREMAHRDALTGAFNRHHLMDTLERDIGRCERGGPPFLLLLADIDHFKRINDSHGHLVGDEALRVVARELHETLRKADYMARYGGEEFVLIVSVEARRARGSPVSGYGRTWRRCASRCWAVPR
jgi:diguanylate cyclase